MIEVRVDEQRVVAAQHRAQLVVDPHRAHHRQPGADPDRLDVRDRAQPTEQVPEPARREQQRIAAREQHVADPWGPRDVVEPGLELGRGRRLVAADQPAPVAVAAVDAAAIDDQEQHAIGVLVDDRRCRVVAVLAERIAELLGADLGLRAVAGSPGAGSGSSRAPDP